LPYGGERSDARALDQLEAILRAVTEELSVWRTRALKSETDRKSGRSGGGGGSGATADSEMRGRLSELESENKVLRARVETARARVGELLSRLTFLEEQAREPGAGAGAGAGAGVSK
jgi:hypothetical protein